MKRLLILGTFIGSTALPAYANHPNLRQATRASQELVQALVQTAQESNGEAMASRRRGQDLRANKFQNLSQDARMLAQQVRRSVLNPLRQRRNINFIRQQARQLRPGFQRLQTTAGSILFMPVDIRYSLQDVSQWQQALRQSLFGYTGGPGGPGGPGYGPYKATCEVVLETLWGSDLQKFYGRAVARNPQMAVAQAEREAMQQCGARRSGLTQCTVNRNHCGLTRGF